MENSNQDEEYPVLPYEKWSEDPRQRWINAGNTFGVHLLKYVRDEALRDIARHISPDASPECREVANKAIDATLFRMMDFLDGRGGGVDETHGVTYSLLAHITDENDVTVETFELAPKGDGLALGYAGWCKGNFGQKGRRDL